MIFPWISPRGCTVLSSVKVSRIHVCCLLFSLVIATFLIGSVHLNKSIVTLLLGRISSIFFPFNSIPDSSSQFPNNVHQKQTTKKNSIAVCFVGMTRSFELTGPTLKKHLLGSFGYSNADVFLISPFDENSYKLSVLEGINLVSFRVFNDFNINETMRTTSRVSINGGTNRQQGLMQQFHMEERCIYDIEMRERKQGWLYEWVVRTRLDGFWTRPPPLLTGLDHTKLYVPSEYADYGGLNDRFSLANRRNTWVSISRFSMLWNFRFQSGQIAERLLKSLLRLSQIEEVRIDLHFCIFSAHMDLDMISIKFDSPVGGYYCRPCITNSSANESLPSGERFCIKEKSWMSEWEKEFDSAVEIDQRHVRKHLNEITMNQCVKDWEKFKRVSVKNARRINPNVGLVWESPPAQIMCLRKLLGQKHKIGYYYSTYRGNYVTFYHNIHKGSEVFSLSLTRALAWPWEIGETKVQVKRVPLPIKSFDKNVSFESQLEKINQVRQEGSWKWPSPGLPQIDIILLDIGSLAEVVIEEWERLGKSEPTCQLLINFAYLNSTQSFLGIQRSLLQFGLHLDSCLNLDSEVYGRCTFFSDTYCKP